MPDGKPGNAEDTPFGNGKGDTMSGGEGPDTQATMNPEQTEGEPLYDKDSIPKGGPLPFSQMDPTPTASGDPGIAVDKAAKVPFKGLK